MAQQRKPYVRITPEGPGDGGDFGPHTPGTGTGGFQEAFDYAHKHCRDIHVFGGRGGGHDGVGADPGNCYTLEETLYIPWSQDLRVDGGNYQLHYARKTGHGIVIDSQMNCRYKLGLCTSDSEDGATVLIRPSTAGPDDFVVVVASIFDFSAVCGNYAGIIVDPSEGGISGSRIFAEETNTHHIGFYVKDDGTGRGMRDCCVEIMFTNQNHATGTSVGMRIGDPGSNSIRHCRFRTACHAPRGVYFDEEVRRYIPREGFVPPDDAIAVDIHAQNNVFEIASYGKRAPGKDLVFEPDARDNTVYAFALPNGVRNAARHPTNRLIMNQPVGFEVSTPAVPAPDSDIVNDSARLVQTIILSPGDVSKWTLTDAQGSAQTIWAGLSAGQTLLLEPGDRVRFSYTEAPTWKWKAIR